MTHFMEIDKIVTDYHRIMESRDWARKIPMLELPIGIKIKAIPPFGGAVIRYLLSYKDRNLSIYLDCYDLLGCEGQPYWEIHRVGVGDPERFLMNDMEELLEGILMKLDYKEEETDVQ